MRVLHIDIDTLRADHLGCYGYHRRTSPNIDAIARAGIRFEDVYASDVPCLPSRTALLTGRFGFHNGVVNHGGTDADPVIGGPDRKFVSQFMLDSYFSRLKRAGLRTVSISSFAHRHAAFHWHAGLDEAHNVGKYGFETADEVFSIAKDWLERRGRQDNWYLHVHLWDPHQPYRAPASYAEPFSAKPTPAWLTEDVRAKDWQRCGPYGAQECTGWDSRKGYDSRFPRQPNSIPDMAAVRAMFDGYDVGVLMADEYVGRLLGLLADLGVDDETAIVVSTDHGETLGEMNVYGDHLTADNCVTRIPIRGRLPEYLRRLRETGRSDMALLLEAKHGRAL